MPDIARHPCPHCGESIAVEARMCRYCGADPHQRAAAAPAPPLPIEETDATGGIIPYKNPPALAAYYLGVFAVIPFFPIGLAGLYFGVCGLKLAKKRPAVRGKIHAWIGIVAGGLLGLFWLGVTVWLLAVGATPEIGPF